MKDWFTNKGQLIQTSAAVLSCLLTLLSFLIHGVSAGWLISSFALVLVVGASAWMSFVAAHRRRRSVLTGFLRRSRELAASYRELARTFPGL